MNILHFLKLGKKKQELASLSKSLSEYGLSPAEWELIKEDRVNYKIANKYEPKFFFRGRIQFRRGRKIWGSIQLAGI